MQEMNQAIRLMNESYDGAEQAIPLLRSLIHKYRDLPEAYHLLGGAHIRLGQPDRAIGYLSHALKLDPELHVAHVDLAYAYHLTNKSHLAWDHYEHRMEYYPRAQEFIQKFGEDKRWGGQPLGDKKLLIYCDQGSGDLIQFCRFIPLIEGYVIIRTPESLQDILKHNRIGSEWVIDECDNVLPDYDYHCSIMSLPYLLMEPDISGSPYLKCYKRATLTGTDKFNIGIAWVGNPTHTDDEIRCCPLEEFRVIHNLPGVRLFSLCPSPRLLMGCEDMRIANISNHLTSFENTAAIMKELDLVLTVDTAVLHLAGAMGIESWALLPKLPDWRWGIDGERTQWYDSIRLFRQKEMGDWCSLMHGEIKNQVEKKMI